MKKTKKQLSRQPLVAAKQIALSFQPGELTIGALSKAILCLPEARELLCKKLEVGDEALVAIPSFINTVGASEAKSYNWPAALLEDDIFAFIDETLNDGDDESGGISSLEGLVNKLYDKENSSKWFKAIVFSNADELALCFSKVKAQLSDNQFYDTQTMGVLLDLLKKQANRRMLKLDMSPFPVVILTYKGQDEMVLMNQISIKLTGNKLLSVDETMLEAEGLDSLLENRPSSMVVFRFSFFGAVSAEFDQLMNYFDSGWQSEVPKKFIWENIEGEQFHLLDKHFLVFQLLCPEEFDLDRFKSENIGAHLLRYVRQQRSESIELYGDMSRLQRLLQITNADTLFVYKPPKTPDLLNHLEKEFKIEASKSLAKELMGKVSEEDILRFCFIFILGSIGVSITELMANMRYQLYSLSEIIPIDGNKFEGIQFDSRNAELIEALTDRKLMGDYIDKCKKNGNRLTYDIYFDIEKGKIYIHTTGFIKTSVLGDSKYMMPANGFTFDQVVGMEEAKGRLQMIIDYFLTPDKFDRFNVKPPMRLVLSGPPGCGKTMIAKAFANHINIPFYSISAAEITSQKYAGWGAGLLRSIFDNAKKTAPSVIFLDELDAFGNRASYSSDSAGFDARSIMNTLLVLLDGIDTDERIVVMAATNRIEDLDKALLRPKRFGTVIEVDHLTLYQKEALIRRTLTPSDCQGDYNQIVDYLLARTSGDVSPAKIEDIISELKLKAIAKHAEKISYADLHSVLDDMLLGKKVKLISEEHKISKAYHEAAFAVLHKAFFPKIPIETISVQYRTESFGGTTLNQNLSEETAFYTDEELIALMVAHLAAPLAEKRQMGKYSVSSSAGFAVAARISILLAGNMDHEKGLQHSIQYALYELDNTNHQFVEDLNRLSARIIETASVFVEKYLEQYWALINTLANKLIQMENLDKLMITQVVSDIEQQEIKYDDFIETFKTVKGSIGFRKDSQKKNA